MTRGRGGVGLDGCPGGWVAVHVLEGRGVVHAAVVRTVTEACDRFAPAAVAIDIPIGLSDTLPRPADAAARRLLGRGASAVFNAPPRSLVDAYRRGDLDERAYARANARTRAVAGQGLSRQTWGLVPKIAEVDAFVAGARIPVVEVHPEVQFRLLAGEPLPRKTSWAGVEVRRRLLAARGIVAPADLAGGEHAAVHDVLDAAAVADVAAGLAAGVPLRSLPADPPRDAGGSVVAIWARGDVSPAAPPRGAAPAG